MLNEQLVQARQQAHLSQVGLATALRLPLDQIQAWEQGTQWPRYQDVQELDRVIGSRLAVTAYGNLKFRHLIGHRASVLKVVLVATLLVFFDFFASGFGFQPTYVFVLVLLITTFVTFPMFFDEYWSIDERQLTKIFYADNYVANVIQLFVPQLREHTEVPYSTIDSVTIQYFPKPSSSAVKLRPEYFTLNLKQGNLVHLIVIDRQLAADLPAVLMFFSAHNIPVSDPLNAVAALKDHAGLSARLLPVRSKVGKKAS